MYNKIAFIIDSKTLSQKLEQCQLFTIADTYGNIEAYINPATTNAAGITPSVFHKDPFG